MRPFTLLLPASLLVLASSAGAQDLPYPQPDTGSVSTVQVSPAKTVRIRDEQAANIVGSYAMSNGWYLKVRPATRHIEAKIDDRAPLRLLAVAPYKFASPDGSVTMEFNRGNTGEDMLMSYMPDPRLARVVVISSAPLAQR